MLILAAGHPLYSVKGSIDSWRVFLKAPLGSQREVYWDLALVFPAEYPHVCPVFRFLSLPKLRNVSKAGRVSIALIEKYHPAIHVAALLKSIRGLFEGEEEKLPYDGRVIEDLGWSEAEYDELIAKATEEPWLPIPEIDYLPIVSPNITGREVTPNVVLPEDLEVTEFSQLSWKPIREGERAVVRGIVVRESEVELLR
jgi:ubiquitin-protein ligase